MPCLPISKWKATWNGCCCGFSIRTVKPKEAKALLDDPTLSNIEPQLLVNLNNANTNVTNTSNLLEAEVDGFDTLPEPVSIEVEDCNVAPFSLPQECLNYVPDPNAVVLKFQNGESERMISCNTELSKDELSMLRKCQEEAARQKLAFLPSISIAAVRYLGDIGDVEEAVKKMQENQAWRLSYFQKPLQDFEMLEDLQKGFLYFCGRDAGLRPALVMRPSRCPPGMPSDQFGRLFVFCMEYFLRYMLVPGKVENVVVIVDLNDISYSQMPPVSALLELKDVLVKQDAGRVFCFYVCNLPFIVRAAVGVVQAAMTEKQRQKMRFVSDVSELQGDFALNQLESDLGGTRELETNFFPFPLPPGPFTAGCPGSNSEATPNLHRLLTAEAARGRLWDPKKSGEENRQIPFSATSAQLSQLQRLEIADVGTKAPEIQTPKGLDQQVNSECMFFCNPFCRVGCHVAR
eukprot:symbB.v1.2.001328.t1/scaffold57.1/size370615/37